MNLEDFKNTLTAGVAPSSLTKALQAMWYDGKGDWNRAHDIAQEIHSAEGSWIHAYLHRKEGDNGNAAYWYHRASQPVCQTALEEEWANIVKALLS
jgi:hypothetical protein